MRKIILESSKLFVCLISLVPLFSWLLCIAVITVEESGAAELSGRLHTVTIVDANSGNMAPVPSVEFSISGGIISFDASKSSDADGSINSYDWDFGDGTTAEGAVVSHSFTTSQPMVTLTVIDDAGAITISQIVVGLEESKVGWTLNYADSEELVGEDAPATNAFDGDPSTIWHSEWKNASPSHPHEIQINLGATYALGGFSYLPRQDGGTNGTVTSYEFYVSDDGNDWGSPVTQGSFDGTLTEQTVTFAKTYGKFIRFIATGEVNDNPWTSMAELNLVYE